ncbi:MAG: VWA domain-containing protein [Clostridium sp.]|uniref:VWA domain-containing protein n=1 Tax=Clostridium sp. TaxID=1506 RepID=UPI003D6C7A2B
MSTSVNLSKEQTISKVNLSKNTLKVCLEKKKLTGEKARVAFIIDTSGSMTNYFRTGRAQSIIERILPLALEFDDNGELDMFQFSNKVGKLMPVTLNGIYKYVDTQVMPYFFGKATYYEPPLKAVYDKYVVSDPSKDYPTYVIFLTDGDNFDHKQTENIIKKLSHENIFIQFIGIGNEKFKFLKKLDTLSGRFIDNANFFSVDDIDKISDEELYKQLMNEYPEWLMKVRAKGLISSFTPPVTPTPKLNNTATVNVTSSNISNLNTANSKTIKKGQKMSLNQSISNLSKLLIAIDWDINSTANQPVDIDTSIFMMDNNKKTEESNFIFYNNPKSSDGGIALKADHGTSLINAFKNVVQVDLNSVPNHIQTLAFTITIDEAEERSQDLRLLQNGQLRVIDAQTMSEVFTYKFSEGLSTENALVIAEIYRYKSEWKISPEGSGFNGGLQALCDNYGITTC